MSKPRYLTKSRYKMGIECPTKLFYTGKKKYANSKMDDPFLASLADGGHQVGELAKYYFPNGHDITTLDYNEAEAQTLELLKQDDVIIYEPAIRFKNLFIRIDVLVKKGNTFRLIEVKAKSFDTEDEEPFLNKNGTIKSTWKPYLYDIAFQKFVLASAYPEYTISSYLMMADKNMPCPVEGLNQKFRIVRDESNRKGISVSNTLGPDDLKKKILIEVPVDEYVQMIHDRKDSKDIKEQSFKDEIEFLAEKYEMDNKINSIVGTHCQSCEYKCSNEDSQSGLLSGFKECWKKDLGWKENDFEEANILEIWNFRGKQKLFDKGIIKLKDVCEDDISPKVGTGSGISSSERQWLQIEKENTNDKKPFFDAHGMKLEMEKWTFPLHFIDFETTAVAIPFNKGRKPYEGVAFQFSHHTVTEDGTIEHSGEYINTSRGVFPNYEFVRELKKQLENDSGTIFRYAPHENTFLNLIYRQLNEESCTEDDKEELCDFIKTITKSVGSSVEKWNGERCMVDMWELVKKYYYHPYTKGSNSIKFVLPSILNASEYLKEKYSKPIYGSSTGIKSINFENWKWIKMKGEDVVDPYKLLPKMFQDISDRNMKILTEEDELKNGGAALTAYGKMQFSEITDYEKKELTNALLKYCELDTFAMVMIYEGWREMVSEELGEEAA
jgi:hypothetical protein